jgi:hypothetical protein
MSEATCRDRIQKSLESREEMIGAILQGMADGNDEAYEEFGDLPLEVSEYTVLRILLSWGGPSDWIEVKIGAGPKPLDYEILSMKYHFQDWFDHAATTIYDDSPLWAYCSQLVDIHYS